MANNNEFHTVVGKAMYAKVFAPSTPSPDQVGVIPVRWTVDVLLDAAGRAQMQLLNAKITPSGTNQKYMQFIKDNGLEEAGYDGSYIRVNKNVERKVWDADLGVVKINADGTQAIESATRPIVEDSAGNEIPYEAYEKHNFKIGNGSDVKVTFTLTGPAIGKRNMRLVRTHILNLVKVEAPKTGTYVYGEDSAGDELATPF